MQIERIVGGHRVPIAQRSEAERRARTLASLARTLNEVKRLRAEEEKPKHMSVRRSVLAGAAGKVAGKAAGKVARKAAKKKVATKNTAATKAAEEFASGKAEAAASGNNDAAAKRVVVKSYTRARTPRKRSAVERLNDRPPPMADPLPPPGTPTTTRTMTDGHSAQHAARDPPGNREL
jgi:hypothetical protein